jgi:GTP-binding protein HflX
MNQLNLESVPMLTVYNKADKIDDNQFVPTLFPNVLISAKSSKGKEQLIQAIKLAIMESLEPYTLSLQQDEGKLLNRLKRETLLLSSDYEEETQTYLLKGFAQPDSYAIRQMN